MHQGAKKSACRNTPPVKCATLKTSDAAVPPGYDNLSYVVRIKGNGTREQFAEIHKMVMATSPNFYNVSRPVDLNATLVVE
jgi:hypothetical protein